MERPLNSTIYTVLAFLGVVMMLVTGLTGEPFLGVGSLGFGLAGVGMALIATESLLAIIRPRCPDCPPCPPYCPPWTHYLALAFFLAAVVGNFMPDGSLVGLQPRSLLVGSALFSILGIGGRIAAISIEIEKMTKTE